MPERRLFLFVLLLLGGCANLSSMNLFRHDGTALDAAGELVSPRTGPAKRAQLIDKIKARYHEDPSPDNTLALAVVYAVPGQPQSSNTRALALLNQLDTSKLTRASRLLADWLSNEVAYRDSLEHSNARLGNQLTSLKEALARAREKIEILTRIEQTIGPAPQLDQNQGDQH